MSHLCQILQGFERALSTFEAVKVLDGIRVLVLTINDCTRMPLTPLPLAGPAALRVRVIRSCVALLLSHRRAIERLRQPKMK